MKEDYGRTGKTLPFTRPEGGRRTDKTGGAAEEEHEAMLEIIRQQPDINISRTILLHGQVESGRYQVNASRVADRLLDLENRLQEDQGKGVRNSSSSGRSSTSSTSHNGSSN